MKYLKETVNSISNQVFPNLEIIIVVDSDERLYGMLTKEPFRNAKVLLSKVKGASNARNCGIKEAVGDILFFIDDDIIVEKDWLKHHISKYKDPSIIGVGGMIKPLWQDKANEWIPEEMYWTIGCTFDLSAGFSSVRNVFSGNCSFRKEVLQRIPFPTLYQRCENSLRGTEDTQICIEAQKFFPNHRIVYEPKAVAYHRIQKDKTFLNRLLMRAYSEGLSKAYIARKYSDGETLTPEKGYLFKLVSSSIPGRLFPKTGMTVQNLKQVFSVTILTLMVGLGYVSYRWLGEKDD
jgi:glycosyltransferase involved in cell wall biosynthesis